MTIKNIKDFQDIVICALRYALGRRTYVTDETADFIKAYPEMIDERVKSVMLRDLNDYFTFRRFGGYTDDDCDYKTWLSLEELLKNL